MHRFALILAACLFGCNTDVRRPAIQPTTASSTQPILKSVEMHYGIYLARLDLHITVSPDGLLRSVRTDNKSYGGNDVDPKHERVEIREGKLTAEQMADLAHLFADWDSLSSHPYGGVPDGGEIKIRYGDKTVSGGSAVPKQVTDVRVRLSELAQSMPVVKP
jgi:hypothetical protein